MENLNRFYTYAYLREDGTPYYIGKGMGERIYKRGKNEIKPPKDKSRVIFFKRNITEEEAFKHEIYMISIFGRKDLGTGSLRNRTNGGEGSSGLLVSDETRRKISKARTGTKMTEEHKDKIRQRMMGNNWNVGRKLSEETKKKVGEAQKGNQYMKGRKYSEETRKKMSEAHKGNTPTEETRKKLSQAKKGNQNWKYRKPKNQNPDTP